MEDNFTIARRRMVEEQIIARGVKDEKVVKAMLRVPRHLFVESALRHQAYNDYPLPIGDGQTISQPYMVAVMTELLSISEESRVLEIGTGSGYQTAVLAEIAANVYTIERLSGLSQSAKKLLREQGYENIAFRAGDGTLGWREFSPYDGILVTAGVPKTPKALIEQLAEKGRLIIPIGHLGVQTLTVITKRNGALNRQELFNCQFVPLIGKDA